MVSFECCTGNCVGGVCGEQCLPNGFACNVPGECCTGQCFNGICGGCLPNGALCGDPDECCSSVCAQGVCGGACTPNGSFCNFPEECCSGSCNGGVCGPPCQPNGSPCMTGPECCAGVCDGGFCGIGVCDHGQCEEGGPLSPACNACAGVICDFDPFCCQVMWDSICVDEAAQFCGCDPCLPNGAACMSPADCCSGTCTNNVCGPPPPPCPHSVCAEGVALGPQCGACVVQVCGVDPFCCQSAWDAFCVAEAEQLCGVDCTQCSPLGAPCMTGPDCCSGTCAGGLCANACTPDGGMCMSGLECCSGSCFDGVCQEPCQPDGSFCFDPDECCSGSCVSGICGFSQCPSDGSPCGDCIADNCCTQILDCFDSPDCIDDVTCFFTCIPNGGPVQCFLQCVQSPQAFQLLFCLGQNCGPGICF
jgi:hypothetical protein